jgi:putative ABC transport system permease protein
MQEEINKTSTLIECQSSSSPGMFSGGPSGLPFSGFQQVFINETAVEEIRSVENVKDVVPFLEVSSNETTSETIAGPGGRNFTVSRPLYAISGLSLNSTLISDYSILPANITDGRNLKEGDTGVVVMSSNLTDFFGVDVDGIVEINGGNFVVVGICQQTGQTRTVYMNISDAQTITGQNGNVSRLDVYAESVSDVAGIAEVIKAVYSELRVTTYEDRLSQLQNMQTMYEQTLTNAQSTLDQTQTIATQEIIIAVAATSLIVLFVMLYTVRERTKEIGTMKAIGFSNWSVMSQFMLEGMFICLMAAAVGVGIAIIGAPVFISFLLPSVNLFGGSQGPGGRTFGSGVPGGQTPVSGLSTQLTVASSLDPQLILLMFGAAALLGALGALYPAWRASKTSPMEALRNE